MNHFKFRDFKWKKCTYSSLAGYFKKKTFLLTYWQPLVFSKFFIFNFFSFFIYSVFSISTIFSISSVSSISSIYSFIQYYQFLQFLQFLGFLQFEKILEIEKNWRNWENCRNWEYWRNWKPCFIFLIANRFFCLVFSQIFIETNLLNIKLFPIIFLFILIQF